MSTVLAVETRRPSSTIAPSSLLVLALLTAVAPLATDMYLPGFPAMAADLGVSASAIQLTLTTFLLGLAIGQLVIGPLSDRWGRRPLLIAGTLLCVGASAACALAPSVELLTTFRFLQGFGGAAGLVLSRAVISDRARGAAASRIFSVMMMINGVAPVVAPLVGGVLIGSIGWRGVFWVITGLAVVMLVGVVAWVAETHPPHLRSAGGLRTLLGDAVSVIRRRRFLGYTGTFAFGFTVMFAYISASPFVLQNALGLSEAQYSIAFAANATGLVLVSALNAKIVGRVVPRRLLQVGTALIVGFSALLLIDALTGPSLWATLILLWCTVTALGLVMANATSLALQEASAAAGTGSAILGALQFGMAAAISPIVGIAGSFSAVPMAIAMTVCALIAASALALTR